MPAVTHRYGDLSDVQLIDICRRIMGIPNVLDDDSLREYSCQLAGETCNTHGLIVNVDFWRLCF